MRNQLITLIVVLASAMVVSTMARAAGETKNQAPFTRLVVQAQSESRGEAKNELPFTLTSGAVPDVFERYASAHPYGAQEQAAPSGEAKNELPFTATRVVIPDVFERYASTHPYGRGTTIARSTADGGVQWRYVLGGSAIGGVLLLIGLVGLQARRRSHSVPVTS